MPEIDRASGRRSAPADTEPRSDPARLKRSGSRFRGPRRGCRAAPPGRTVQRAGRSGLRLPLRPRTSPAGHRLQRRRSPPRRQLLRSARVGGAPGQLRRDRAGQAAPGALVQSGPAPHHVGGQAGAPVVERLDVRVPHAALWISPPQSAPFSTRPTAAWSMAARSSTAASMACRGASPSRAIARPTRSPTTVPRVGVPGLGFKRGLADDLVIAPYASASGADDRRRGVVRQPAPARARGPAGRYGFYEAVDYTPRACPAAKESHRAFVHGAPPGDVAPVAGYLLLDRPMQRRSDSDHVLPRHRSSFRKGAEDPVAITPPPAEVSARGEAWRPPLSGTCACSPRRALPVQVQLLNGNYHVAITNSGGGWPLARTGRDPLA